MKARIKITGTQKLKAALLDDAQAKAIREVVYDTAYGMQRVAMQKAPTVYNKGYSTGATQQNIKVSIRNNELTGIVGMSQDYNPFTEYGTRFMAAEPVLQPVFNDSKDKFIADIKRLIK